MNFLKLTQCLTIITVKNGIFHNAESFITDKIIKANCLSDNNIFKILNSIDTKYILIIADEFYAINNYKYVKHEFFKKHILPILSKNDFFGYWFLSQNLNYGEFYNICIYDNNKLKNYIKNCNDIGMNKETLLNNILEPNFNKNHITYSNLFKFTNITIAFYHDINYKNPIYRISNENNYYIKTMLKLYKLNNIEEIKLFYKKNFDYCFNENDCKQFNEILINNDNVINLPYCNSIIYNNNIKLIDNSFWLNIINKYKQLTINEKKNYDMCFVLCHYMYNNNFERKIGYYIKKLTDYNINCCIMIPISSKYNNKILFSSYFNEENIIFVENFNYNILSETIEKYNIKYLNFIDMLLIQLNNQELLSIKKKCNINLIVSGFLSGLNSYILNNDIFSNIITNSKAHSLVFKNKNVKIHQYWEIRKFDKININESFKQKKIVYIGRFYEEKQCELLYEAFVSVSKKYSDYTFEFYGSGNTLDNKNNTNNIKIHNKWLSNDEVNQIIKDSLFIIQNSISEGNPAIIWESFNLATPVICSNIYGNNDCVNDGQNGFLFDLHNYNKIKNDITIKETLSKMYKSKLDSLKPFYHITKDNICNTLTKAIEFSKNNDNYKKMQNNCLESFKNYTIDLDPIEIYKLFT